MAVQNLGNSGGAPPQLAPAQGNTPRPVAQRESVAAEVVTQAAQPKQPSREEVRQAVEEMRKSLTDRSSSNLQFSVDNDTGQTIVRVTDVQTGELIRQIPSEELVELAKSLDRMQGNLLRQQV